MSSDHHDPHDAHGAHDPHHDDHGHGHDDHGHHAPPAPKYYVYPPARASDVPVRSWVAYGIFLAITLGVTALMLALA